MPLSGRPVRSHSLRSEPCRRLGRRGGKTVTRSFDRRAFVSKSVSALVLGLVLFGTAGAADRPAEKPDGDLLEAARKRIKEEIKPGVVIIVPEEESAQNYLALRLTRLLG